MSADGSKAKTSHSRRGISDAYASAPTARKEPKRHEIGWWDVPLLPSRLFRSFWQWLKPSFRSGLRIIAWVLIAAALIGIIPLALQWKSGQAWEDFLQHFVTSPAAAGSAAVLAAVIASTTFNRGLQHSKAEARDKAWWEKFEWVTDRIVPKDPKQERLASGLALSMLGSLEDSSDEGFQREAVAGIKQTYIQGQQTSLSTATLGELKAQLREVQTFADSSWHSGEVSNNIRSYAYRLATSVALREIWDAKKIELEHTFPNRPQTLSKATVDALLRYGGLSALVETRYTPNARTSMSWVKVIFERRFQPLMDLNKIDNLILVINHELRASHRLPGPVQMVYWEQEHGPEALRDRIQQALREAVPLAAVPTSDPQTKVD